MTMLPTDPPLFPDGFITADDVVTMPLQCATQWDSLAHVGYDGLLYNNTPASAVSAFRGATRNSFDQVVSRLISRGVLLDIARLKGVDRLDRSGEITADDLDAAAARQGVEVRAGDVHHADRGEMTRATLHQHRLVYGPPAPGPG
jgi:Putative cyclase